MGAAAGPAAQPPTRVKPVCFDAVETACGRKAAVCGNLRGAPAGAFVKKIAGACGGASLLEGLVSMPTRRGWSAIACGGESFTRGFNLYAYPAGAYFCAYKSRQNTLGALPQDPCRWLCWIRISFSLNDREKQIRTAHRIAPKVAAAHLPFPPTPFPDGGKGARMGWQL